MHCIECPYIKDEYESKSNQFGEFDIEYCWCDKVGGKIWHFGVCGDSLVDGKTYKINKRNPRKRSKRQRDIYYKNKLKRLIYNNNRYTCPVIGVIKDGEWTIQNIIYCKKYSPSKSKQYLQRVSNKRIRKVPVDENIQNGCNYKKYYDLEWKLN